MKCSNCDMMIPDGSPYCAYCGAAQQVPKRLSWQVYAAGFGALLILLLIAIPRSPEPEPELYVERATVAVTVTPREAVSSSESGSLPSDSSTTTPRAPSRVIATPTRRPRSTNTPRTEPSPTRDTVKQDILELLEDWDAIHHRADRYWRTNELSTVLRQDALEQQVATVASLKEQNCYWKVSDLASPRVTAYNMINHRLVTVEVRKNWDMDLYCNGRKSGDDDGPFTMRYRIEQFDGRWYITRKELISTN